MVAGNTWPQLEMLGKLVLELRRSADWVLRRVETVQLIDASQVERTVSLDIDRSVIAELARVAAEPSGPPSPTYRPSTPASVLVPLTRLPKTLLLDLDIRDDHDASVGLAVSDEDSTAAQAALLAHLETLHVDVATLPQSIIDNLFRIARLQPSFGEEGIIRNRRQGRVPSWDINHVSEAERMQWFELFQLPSFKELLSTFTINYMPMVRLSLRGDLAEPFLLKYRHIERQQPARKPDLRERFSLDAYPQLIEAPSLGSGSREHLRFVAPPGLFLEEFYLPPIEPAPQLTAGPQPPNPAPPDPSDGLRYETRLTPERGVLYTRKAMRSEPPLVATALLRPKVNGFLRAAQYTVLLTSFLLTSGAVAQYRYGSLSRGTTSTEAAVALLLIVPSTMSAFLARGGEHELLSDLLRAPRLAVASSAAAAVAAAGALILHVSSWRLGTAWAVAAIIGLTVWALLFCISHASSRALREVADMSHRTLTFGD